MNVSITSLACFDARRTCGAALDASGGSARECLDEKKNTWPCQMCILETLSCLCSHFSLFIWSRRRYNLILSSVRNSPHRIFCSKSSFLMISNFLIILCVWGTCAYVCVCVHTRACVSVHVPTCALYMRCVLVSTCAYMCVRVHNRAHVCLHVRACQCVCVHDMKLRS